MNEVKETIYTCIIMEHSSTICSVIILHIACNF